MGHATCMGNEKCIHFILKNLKGRDYLGTWTQMTDTVTTGLKERNKLNKYTLFSHFLQQSIKG